MSRFSFLYKKKSKEDQYTPEEKEAIKKAKKIPGSVRLFYEANKQEQNKSDVTS
jgi:hypothetical protein